MTTRFISMQNDDCHFFLHFEYWIFQTLKIESLGQSNSCTHLQHFSMLPKAIFLLWIQRLASLADLGTTFCQSCIDHLPSAVHHFSV
ncbi:hypothetical protein BDA96_02G191600 [Sorghum bicolor]|uniref:Uncharacterized protein n=2 Tax=Sorghum bicolor TaxID=4558 RepID=A0A1W0W4U0_SORBI|nr:hypothetical protein BDA96_02G191600 [Sorghum bicolor]OQU89375.1 hypothetical protein SORBI_3002G181450 [Sorghum bicolor]OQU89382.1 hypothetical protein SORBI_3002G181450 [Sorghum bicolor]OQU89383.1 hypothetical protein SORBI_3002G181450 [Sorghum bicolor]